MRATTALLAAGMLALASCGPLNVGTGPAPIAESTILDEKAALGVELAYKTARTLAELAVDVGLVKPGTPTARRVADADNRAYAAVQAARAAYRAGNATSYGAAVGQALGAIEALRVAVKG